nr:unnamed protein product [Callosobruchus chinensis]
MYADVKFVLITGNNFQTLKELANKELKCIQQWFIDEGLILATAKTQLIRFVLANIVKITIYL